MASSFMNAVHGIHPSGQQSCLKSLQMILSFALTKLPRPAHAPYLHPCRQKKPNQRKCAPRQFALRVPVHCYCVVPVWFASVKSLTSLPGRFDYEIHPCISPFGPAELFKFVPHKFIASLLNKT